MFTLLPALVDLMSSVTFDLTYLLILEDCEIMCLSVIQLCILALSNLAMND